MIMMIVGGVRVTSPWGWVSLGCYPITNLIYFTVRMPYRMRMIPYAVINFRIISIYFYWYLSCLVYLLFCIFISLTICLLGIINFFGFVRLLGFLIGSIFISISISNLICFLFFIASHLSSIDCLIYTFLNLSFSIFYSFYDFLIYLFLFLLFMQFPTRKFLACFYIYLDLNYHYDNSISY